MDCGRICCKSETISSFFIVIAFKKADKANGKSKKKVLKDLGIKALNSSKLNSRLLYSKKDIFPLIFSTK